MHASGLQIPYIDFGGFFHSLGQAIVDAYPGLVSSVKNFSGFMIGLSLVLSVFFMIVIIHCVEQLKVIRRKEAEMYDLPVVPAYTDAPAQSDVEMAERWQGVINHISSNNQNDWRQAIIDADIMLDRLLTKMGYRGETIGEKLQRVVKGDFASLQDAWEGHKVRNQVAHAGSEFSLNQAEAKKAIDHYRKVFEEFYSI